MTLTDQQIYDNRLKWAKFLQQPERKKMRGFLEHTGDSEARCCLGHACALFELPRTVQQWLSDLAVHYGSDQDPVARVKVAPNAIVEMLGLNDYIGRIHYAGPVINHETWGEITSLANLNDQTAALPRDIGMYIEAAIFGGPNTPFTAIDKDNITC